MLKKLMEKYFKDVIDDNPEIMKEVNIIFESILNTKIEKELDEKKKALKEESEKKLDLFKTEIIEKLDDYINLSMDEFIEEHKTNISDGLKVELAEKTLSAIKNIFKESAVEIPEGEKDIIKELESKIQDLTDKLNESVNKQIENEKQIFEFEKAIKFEQLSKDMTEVQKEKLISLSENIDYENINDFEDKIKILKESVFDNNILNKEKDFEDEDFEDDLLDKYLP